MRRIERDLPVAPHGAGRSAATAMPWRFVELDRGGKRLTASSYKPTASARRSTCEGSEDAGKQITSSAPACSNADR
jgi:hypothetical protein